MVVRASVECRIGQDVNAFDLVVGRRHVRCCFPEDDHAAPEAAVALIQIKSVIGVVQLRRENDRLKRVTVSHDLSTTTNDQCRSTISRCDAALFKAFDNRPRFNGQRSAVIDEDEAVKHVGVACGPRLI